MDVVLETHDSHAVLAFKGIERCGDDFSCMLAVLSGGFSAERQFLIDSEYLEQFCRDIRVMDSTLRGSARLGYRYEQEELAFELDKLGHVLVKGLLIDYGPPHQELRFAFRTDQTCLAPLVRDFERVLKRGSAA